MNKKHLEGNCVECGSKHPEYICYDCDEVFCGDCVKWSGSEIRCYPDSNILIRAMNIERE